MVRQEESRKSDVEDVETIVSNTPDENLSSSFRKKKKQKVRWSVDVSDELDRVVEDLAYEEGTNKSDVLRRAVALLRVAHDGKRQNKHLGFTSKPDNLDTEIIMP